MADSSPPPKADPDPNPLPPSPSLPPPLSDPNPPPKPDPDPTPNPLPRPPLSGPNPPPKADPDPAPNPPREPSPSSSSSSAILSPPQPLSPEPEPKALEEYVNEWKERRRKEGVDERHCALPFLTHEPKLVECKLCFRSIYPKEEIRCTVSGCQSAFHLNCAEKSFKISKEKISTKDERNSKKRKKLKGLKFEGLQFKCPQHGCFVCKQIGYWRCVRCMICSHTKCAPWCERVIIPPGQHARAVCWKHPSDWLLQSQGLFVLTWQCVSCSHTKCVPSCERVIIPPGQHARVVCWKHPSDWLMQSQVCVSCSHTKCVPSCERVMIPPGQHARAVCWKHPSDWVLQSQHADVTQSIQEVFDRLPVPYFEEEFNFSTGTNIADVAEKKEDTADMNDDVAESNADVAEKKDDTAEMNDDLAERNDDMANMNDDMAARNDASEKNDDVAEINDDVAEINDDVAEINDVAEKIDVVMKNDDVAQVNDVIMKNDDVAQVNDVIMKNDDLAEINDVVMKIDDVAVKNNEPDPFVRIRRNIYLVKRKRESHAGVGCTGCTSDSVCKEDCECRGLSVSCSKACHCSDFCTNKPFRKDKKIKIVKTEHCGWGVITLEPLEKGDFIVEYIGEVIDDITCEKRLWDIKKRGDFNFYMCEISKDFTIDATFKGNTSRFLNHSCDPNCKLEKWQVDGETRVGVFASRSIKIGEPLTYDYRFVHFGPMVVCKCGASNCQGFLGSKKIVNQLPINSMSQESIKEECIQTDEEKLLGWGQKTKRSEMTKIRNQTPSIDFQNLLIENQTPSIDFQNQLVTNQTSSNDSQNQLIRNQTISNDSQNHLIRSQTPSNDSQNQLMRIQPPQNQSIRNQTPQNQLIRNQTPSNGVQNHSSNDFQNRFDTNRVEISRSIRVKEDRPLSWGRRIKRSYTVSVDQNGSGN